MEAIGIPQTECFQGIINSNAIKIRKNRVIESFIYHFVFLDWMKKKIELKGIYQ